MRINDAWRRCDDNSVRPTIWGEVQDARGRWLEVLLLADSGADRTVFGVDVFDLLGFPRVQGDDRPGDIVCLLSRGEVYHA